jgi:putative tryptophan/tyrosine transport system substrate-binding protein
MSQFSRRQLVQGMGAVGLGLLAGCGRLPGQAQAPTKVPRVGLLWASDATNPHYEAFQAGLRELGYVDGHNLRLESRWSDGDDQRLPSLAAELVRIPVDLIVTEGTRGTAAARAAAGAVPIVMAQIADPVGTGFVASLARPGGTITGLSINAAQLSEKRLELLKETVPRLMRVGVPWDATNPASEIQFRGTQAAADVVGVQVLSLQVHSANDLEPAFHTAKRESVGGLIVFGDPFFASQRVHIASLAAQSGLPVMYNHRQFVDAGGLMAYGPNNYALYRRAAYYVDRILKGTQPADLPVEQPREFEFVIHLRTAQALGLTIPHHVLLQATEVIQ